MVARIGHNWDAAAIAPIIQTMVVVHNIVDKESYDEYDELRQNEVMAIGKTILPRLLGDKSPGRKGLS
jgi:hypothetical protein